MLFCKCGMVIDDEARAGGAANICQRQKVRFVIARRNAFMPVLYRSASPLGCAGHKISESDAALCACLAVADEIEVMALR